MATGDKSKTAVGSKSKPATGAKRTRKTLSAAEMKAKLEKAKAAVAALEQRAYAGELEEAVKKANIVATFNTIKNNVKGAKDIAILAAIGKAAGIKRLEVTQKPAAKRATKKAK